MDKDIERLGKERLGRQKKHKKWMLLTIMLSVIALSASVYNLIQPAHAEESSETADLSASITSGSYETSYDKSTNTITADLTAQLTLTRDKLLANTVMNEDGDYVQSFEFYYMLPANAVVSDTMLKTTYKAYDKNSQSLAFTYKYVEVKNENGEITGYRMEITIDSGYYTQFMDDQSSQIQAEWGYSVSFGSDDTRDESGKFVTTVGTSTVTVDPQNFKDKYDGNKNVNQDISTSKDNGSIVRENGQDYLQYTVTVSSDYGTKSKVNVNDVLSYTGFTVSDVEIVKVEKTNTSGNPWTYNTLTSDNYIFDKDPKSGQYGMSLVLSELDAKEYYTITYRYKVDIPVNAETTVSGDNTVKASSGNTTDWDYVEHSTKKDIDASKFSKNLISKSGKQISDGNVEWTIIINSSQADINGYVLTDSAFDGLEDGAITVKSTTTTAVENVDYCIKKTADEKKQIEFYAPTGSETNTNTYVITYTQNVGNIYGGGTVENTATISSDGYSQEAKAEATISSSGNLEKKVNSAELSTDGDGDRCLIIEWNTDFTVPSSGIKAGTVYTDYLGSQYGTKYQWFTLDQINAIYTALDGLFDKANFDFSVYAYSKYEQYYTPQSTPIAYSEINSADTTIVYYKYEVTFKKDISVTPDEGKNTKTFILNYKSTAAIPDEGNSYLSDGTWSFKNTAQVGKLTSDATYTYQKAVIKTDSEKGETDTSLGSHNNMTVGDSISWTIRIAVTDDLIDDGQTVTFSDQIPNNLELVGFKFGTDLKDLYTAYDASNLPDDAQSTTCAITGTKNGITAENGTYEDNLISVDFSGNWKTQQINYLYVTLTCRIQDGFFASAQSVTVQNQASVKYPGNITYSSNIQQQTITKKQDQSGNNENNGSNEEVDVVKKYLYMSASDAEQGRMNYVIMINPKGEKLNEGNDLTLEDCLSYEGIIRWPDNSPYSYSISLIVSSVKLYEVDADGNLAAKEDGTKDKGDDVNTEDWSFVYDEESNGDKTYDKLSVTVPDGKKLMLLYTYRLTSDLMGVEFTTWPNDITNTVDLIGTTQYEDKLASGRKWLLSKTAASASKDASYTFLKVEKGKYNKVLQGAVFELYEYNGSDFASTGVKYTTDKYGKFTINYNTGGSQPYSFKSNTAYCLKEIEAPDGYLLPTGEKQKEYFFYYSDDTETGSMPENFKTDEHYNAIDFTGNAGETVVENERVTTLSIKKVWKNSDNSDISNIDQSLSVSVDVYRKVGDSADGEYLETVTLDSLNSWTYTYWNLPTTYEGESCTYYVKEGEIKLGDTTDNTEYTVTYDNNDGVVEGTITITNTKPAEYTLPNTGGSGRNLWYMFGGLLALGAGYLLIYKKHKII
jgi:LPXTG-motif cell wall-anchored protein